MMNSIYRWISSDPDTNIAFHLAEKFGLTQAVSRILVSRGVSTDEQAEIFLNPNRDSMHSPWLMQDMDKGADRVAAALENHERILVLGDYDVDGITGTAVLCAFLESQGGHVRYHIPERDTEGYGLSAETVKKAKKSGYDLIITVDSGVSNSKEAKLVSDAGMDLVITDHHEPHAELPEAVAVIDPKREDSKYPFRELAGVGVAFKLIEAVGEKRGIDREELLEKYGEFVALGTVGDLMPLVNENRFFVHNGLSRLTRSRNPGIYALIEVSGIKETDQIDTWHISFGLAPRLNAAGRVWRPRAGVELLLSDSPERARLIARKLDQQNRNRMAEEATIFDRAKKMMERDPSLLDPRALVLFDERWPIGVVGIVASKLMETHNRPVLMFTLSKRPADVEIADDVKGRVCQGSARSIPGFDLYEAMTECADLFVSYGGHALAAGAKIYESDLPKLRERLDDIAKRKIGETAEKPTLKIDVEIPLSGATMDLLVQTRRLAPFGVGNPQPVFCTLGLTVISCRPVGAEGKHLQFKLRAPNGAPTIDAIGFGFGDRWRSDQLEGETLDAAYMLKEDTFTGRSRVRLQLKDIRVNKS